MADRIRIGLDEVVRHFEELEDPRSSVNRRHPLVSVVVIAIMAVLAGAGGSTAIAKWAVMKEELLSQLVPLPNGIPRKDVYRRVLATLKPAAFQACFVNWLEALRVRACAATDVGQPILAVDGKTLRRSHDRSNGLGALHSVSVWASDFGLTLGQVATDEKSNEITAIPELLRLVDIQGAIITIDAMGTQTAIAEQIVEAKADYVLALKRRRAVQREIDAVLRDFAALLTPTPPIPAAPLSEIDEGETPLSRFTRAVNYLDRCALALPCGFTAGGLPISLQIIGRGYDEAGVLRIGRAYEAATEWHQRRPDLSPLLG